MPHWGLVRPVVSTQLMLQLASECGLPLDTCLSATGITPAQITDSSSEIRGVQELDVLRNILRALGPAVPFALKVGLRYHLTTHGMWGFAQLSSCSVRDAIEVALRYWELSYSFNQLMLEVDGEIARLVYDGSANPDDLQAALVERDLAALLTFEEDAFGKRLPALSLQLRGPRPVYAAEFRQLFGVEPEFGSTRNCLTFEAGFLDIRNPLADTFGLRISEEQCCQLLQQRALRSGVSGNVRLEILRKSGEFPSMHEVAKRLGVNRRTLHNQLTREGTSYRELVDEIRATLAQELLASSRVSVDEIAARLGYADTSSFVAAFKRWKGVPPGEYKRGLASLPDRARKGEPGS
jgi:AraC-like DNA-binding protein